MNNDLRARQVALGLIREAELSDGLKPFAVIHIRPEGRCVDIVWAAELPTTIDASDTLRTGTYPEGVYVTDIHPLRALSALVGVTANADDAADVTEGSAELHNLFCGGDVWGQHPTHTRRAWLDDVTGGNIQSGYWEWVASQIEQQADDGADETADATGDTRVFG